PLDTFYDIKHRHRASYASATIIYVLLIIVSILAVYLTSFVFARNDVTSFNFLRYTAIIVSGILLFVFSNYLISTLNNGEGWFKDVYISTAYALMPYVLLTLPIVVLSNIMTQNEIFIYQAMLFIRNGWSILLIVIMIKEIHGYSVSELIKNILLTVFTMVMIALILFLIYVLLNQMIDYFVGIIKEVLLR
ncbi:MAG: YIP1 family protein, partial [Acholeplasmataceae bacterium]